MKANKLMLGVACMALLGASSCKNSEVSFPDYENGSAVYFAYQTPIRTIVLGEDTYNTDRDQAHAFRIGAVSGGTYNGISASVAFAPDESVINGIFLDPSQKIAFPKERIMPSSYYSINGSSFEFNGSQNAFVDVKLNDEFFADSKSADTYYAIPLKLTGINSGDTKILESMNWTLYFVQFVNKYSGVWLRRGVSSIATPDENGKPVTNTYKRHKGVENDDTLGLRTTGLNSVVCTIPVINKDGKAMQDENSRNVYCNVQLDFNGNECTLKSLSNGIEVTGKGTFGDKSEKLAWGNLDRDGIYLDYTMKVGNFTSIATKDTLVFQTRNVKGGSVTIY